MKHTTIRFWLWEFNRLLVKATVESSESRTKVVCTGLWMQSDRCSNGVCWWVGGRRERGAGGIAARRAPASRGRCAAPVPRFSPFGRHASRGRHVASLHHAFVGRTCVVLWTPSDDTVGPMVVLEGGGALLEPALALDGAAAACLERAYAQADVSLKLLPKRYINLHQWLSPVTTSVTAAAAAGKDLKLQIVRHTYI